MRHLQIITALTLGLAGLGYGGELSNQSSEYLRKLNEFEVARVKAVKAEIWQKRAQVAALLNRELKVLIRKGELEGANALKAEIDKITGKVELDAVVPAKVAKKAAKQKLEDWFVGHTWKAYTYGYKFEKRGKVIRVNLEGADKGKESFGRKWKIISADTIEVISSGATRNFTFTSATEGTTHVQGEEHKADITLVE